MKKVNRFILTISIVLVLTSCNNLLPKTEDDIEREIERELNFDVDLIEKIDLEDVMLVCYVAEDENQINRYGYSEFQKKEEGYVFVRNYSTIDRGVDFRSAKYDNSYIFISNNTKGKNLRIRYDDGEEEIVSIDKTPFVYYLEDVMLDGRDFEYHLLDENGEEISL